MTPYSDRYALPCAGAFASMVQGHNVQGVLSVNAELVFDSNWLLGDASKNGWSIDAALTFDTTEKAPVTTPAQIRSLKALNLAATVTAKGNLIPVVQHGVTTMRVWIKTQGAPANAVRFYLEGRKWDGTTIEGAVPYAGQQVQLTGTNGWTQYKIDVVGSGTLFGVVPVLYAAAGTYTAWFGPVSVRRPHLQHGWPLI